VCSSGRRAAGALSWLALLDEHTRKNERFATQTASWGGLLQFFHNNQDRKPGLLWLWTVRKGSLVATLETEGRGVCFAQHGKPEALGWIKKRAAWFLPSLVAIPTHEKTQHQHHSTLRVHESEITFIIMALCKYRWLNGFEEPIAPEAASSAPFTYGLDARTGQEVFRMDDIAQATPRQLRLLFSGRSQEKEPARKWFTTQLHLYGIPFIKSSNKSELRGTLQTAFDAGKVCLGCLMFPSVFCVVLADTKRCDELAPSVAAVRDRLRQEYDDAFTRLEDKMFAEIKGGHAEEANADPPRFVKKYFLDAQGQPDKEKTKEPLSFASWNNKEELDEVVKSFPGLAILRTWSTVLVGWDNTMEKGIENEFSRLELFFSRRERVHSAQANVDLKLFLQRYLSINIDGAAIVGDPRPSAPVTFLRWELQNRKLPEDIVSKAPGLHLKEFADSIVVIGWDASSIEVEIVHLEVARRREQEEEEARERAEKENEEAKKKERWDRRSKGHRDLLAKQQHQPNPLGPRHLTGSYLVQWQHDRDYNDFNDPYSDSELMKLDVFPPESTHGVKASFCFGLIKGTMLLAMSKRGVELLREEQPKHSSYSEHDSDEDHEGQSGLASTWHNNIKVENTSTTGKRQLGDIADPFGVQTARAKRQKMGAPRTEESHSSRVYFQFACSEVEGYPLVDDRNEHIGHLDFDPTGLAAKGVFYLPSHFAKEAQCISIFKIAEEPDFKKKPTAWYEFDGRFWGSRW